MKRYNKGRDAERDCEEKDVSHEFSLVNEDLITSFTEYFMPVMNEQIAQEIFTVDKLRVYFSAYVIPKMPDPLNQYIHRLSDEGFKMQGTSLNVPGVLVRRKR